MIDYWFARYHPGPVGQSGRPVVPLGWKGVACIAGFVLSLVVGGALMLFFGLRDQFAIGIPLFVLCAAAGAGIFLWASVTRTDPVKSVADYQQEGVLQ